MWLLYLLAGVLLIGELLVAFIYVYVLVRRKLDKPGNKKKPQELQQEQAHSLPEQECQYYRT